MTTPVPDLFDLLDRFKDIAVAKDRESLQLVSRLVSSQVAILEAHVAQFKSLQSVLDDRVKTLGGQTANKK
jgi:hypothetical protein